MKGLLAASVVLGWIASVPAASDVIDADAVRVGRHFVSGRETQRVQPTHGGDDVPPPFDETGGLPRDDIESYRGLYVVGSIACSVANAITMMQTDPPRREKRLVAGVGAVLGFAQLTGGLAVLGSRDGVVNGFAMANTMIGGVSLLTNVAALAKTGRATESDARNQERLPTPTLTLAAGPALGVTVGFD